MVSTAVESLESAKNQLLAKISGLENEVKQIEGVIAALAGLNGGKVSEAVQQIMVVEASAPVASGKRVMSAATKAKMKKAQQARWATINAAKAGNDAPAATKPAKKKGKMSAAGRKAISEAVKARWAKVNAAKAKAAKK